MNNFQIPKASLKPHTDNYHGQAVQDPYHWMEDIESKSVQSWVRRQNIFTKRRFEGVSLTKLLKDRLKELQPQKKSKVLSKLPKISIDRNGLQETLTLEGSYDSYDDRFTVHLISKSGDENSHIRILDNDTGKWLKDRLYGTRKSNIEWLPNNQGFFYSACAEKGDVPVGEENYWNSLYFHLIGGNEQQKVLWSEKDKSAYHSARVSDDKRHVIFTRWCLSGKNQYYFSAINEQNKIVPIAGDLDGVYDCVIHQDRIYILTNGEHSEGEVYTTTVNRPGTTSRKAMVAADEGFFGKSIDIIGNHLYFTGLRNATSEIKVYTLNGVSLGAIPLPHPGSAIVWGSAQGKEAWVKFESWTHPSETFYYYPEEKTLNPYSQSEIDADLHNFHVEHLNVTSKDGAQVPVFIVTPEDVKQNGKIPFILYGYGGFDACITPVFSPGIIPIIEAGGGVAFACIRGGGEKGAAWHEAGKLKNKQNSFDDFIATAEYLIDQKYTSPEHLALFGGSNGGLLVASAMTQRPELFKAVKCAVPLLDMLRFDEFPLGALWTDEYGSSNDPKMFDILRAYSPYHNVSKGTTYPTVVFTTDENDSRVHPSHAIKMTAQLQAANRGKNPILLHYTRGFGHGGSKSMRDAIRNFINPSNVESTAFVLDQIGLKMFAREGESQTKRQKN